MITATQHPPLILWNNEIVDVPAELHTVEQTGDTSFMRIINKYDGDYVVNFDKKDPIQVSAAKILFDRMLSNGMTAYKAKKQKKGDENQKAELGSKVKEFDENIDYYLFVPLPAQVGG